LVADFMTVDLATLGQFEVVLFLGVLYHLKDPFLALRRLRQVTAGVAVIESATVILPAWNEERLWMFLEGSELNLDPGNWWAPSPAGLAAMCRAAGFSSARVMRAPLEYSPPSPGYDIHYGRIIVHAYT
jgi:tRNA (mo5U34)-methyltransferase